MGKEVPRRAAGTRGGSATTDRRRSRSPAPTKGRGRPRKSDAEERALWAARDASPVARAALVEKFLPIALRIAGNVSTLLDVDERTSAAQLALIQAVDTFDPARGVQFSSHLYRRVHGAILDAARAADWMTRIDRHRWRASDAIAGRLAQELGRLPTDEEIVAAGGDPQYLALAVRLKAEALDRRVFAGDDDGRGRDRHETIEPARLIPRSDWDRQLVFDHALRGLPMDEKIVFYLLYVKGHTMKFVGEALRVCESRVSQLHKLAIARLRRDGGAELRELLGARD